MKIYQIGRKNSPILVRDDAKQVSRRHAELTISNRNTYYLVDADSRNGTFIKRKGQWVRVRQEQVVPGDQIRLGAHTVVTVADMLRQLSHADAGLTPTALAARN